MLSKVKLRKQALQSRIALSADLRRQASEQIAAILRGWQPYRDAHRVCFYASFGSEVDTLTLIDGFFTGGKPSAADAAINAGTVAMSDMAGAGNAAGAGTAADGRAAICAGAAADRHTGAGAGGKAGAGGCNGAAASPRELYLPRVTAHELVLHRLDPLPPEPSRRGSASAAEDAGAAAAPRLTDRLWRSSLGMPEPGPDLSQAVPRLMDVIIVPGSAFSVQGHRLGYGKGFYDRLLAQAPQALKVGLAFDVQLFPAADFPQEPHDVRLDWLITESGIRRG